MARKRMVTRTIKMTIAQVKAVDVENESMMTMEFKLPYIYKDEKAVLKKCESKVNNPNVKLIKVMDTTVLEVKYGMTEDEFITAAHPLTEEEAEESEE